MIANDYGSGEQILKGVRWRIWVKQLTNIVVALSSVAAVVLLVSSIYNAAETSEKEKSAKDDGVISQEQVRPASENIPSVTNESLNEADSLLPENSETHVEGQEGHLIASASSPIPADGRNMVAAAIATPSAAESAAADFIVLLPPAYSYGTNHISVNYGEQITELEAIERIGVRTQGEIRTIDFDDLDVNSTEEQYFYIYVVGDNGGVSGKLKITVTIIR